MKFKDRCPDKYDEFYSDLQIMCAVAGITGVLEILKDMMENSSDLALSVNPKFGLDIAFF